MASPERIYRGSVRAFSLIFVILGVAILASTLANGGGPLSIGVLLGVAFLVVGIVRGWLGGGGPSRRGGASSAEHRGGGGRDRTRGQAPS